MSVHRDPDLIGPPPTHTGCAWCGDEPVKGVKWEAEGYAPRVRLCRDCLESARREGWKGWSRREQEELERRFPTRPRGEVR